MNSDKKPDFYALVCVGIDASVKHGRDVYVKVGHGGYDENCRAICIELTCEVEKGDVIELIVPNLARYMLQSAD